MTAGAVTVGAPFAGWAMPLAATPDPVFAGGMMGEGLAIEPLESVVRAPCAAWVELVAATGHSVTLLLDNGASLLIHVGVDTVRLGGRGFSARVAPGDRVGPGDPLIELDLDVVATGAPSLATPIVVVGDGFATEPLAIGMRVAAGDPVLRIVPQPVVGRAVGTCAVSRDVVVPLAHGLHARPAARIAAMVREGAGAVRIVGARGEADALSPVGVMKLAVRHGDRITLSGDAETVAAVAMLIEGGMGEAGPPPAPVTRAAEPVPAGAIRGVPASPGRALGPAFRLATPTVTVPDRGEGESVERARLEAALRDVAAAIDPAEPIAAAHGALLADPDLLRLAHSGIAAGRSAGRAWYDATAHEAAALVATGEPLLAERAADLQDIGHRVAARLMGVELAVPAVPNGAVLLGEDLLPSQFMALDAGALAGIATVRGGPTSHVAILAAAAGVPMVVACGPALLDLADGRSVAIDGTTGTVDPAPDVERHAALAAAARARAADEVREAHRPAVTRDGTRIEVVANVGSVEDAQAAVAAGAEGCGLLRTEFLFLDREHAPTEDEQADAYAAIAAALGERPLIVRTLDIGGDKPVAYLPFPREENPALGNRGVRLGLARPDLLGAQFRAILRGVPADRCRIMLPMVVDRSDLLAACALLDAAAAATGRPAPPLGVMVETPAAALVAADLARDAAFLSIGTNDLTQYTLAADRGNAAVAARIDALHPAVLRLIASTCEGAATSGRWVGVCGALASDPAAVPLLLGLGVTELSASAAAVPAVKSAVRRTDMEAARALAAEALSLGTAAQVRELIR